MVKRKTPVDVEAHVCGYTRVHQQPPVFERSWGATRPSFSTPITTNYKAPPPRVVNLRYVGPTFRAHTIRKCPRNILVWMDNKLNHPGNVLRVNSLRERKRCVSIPGRNDHPITRILSRIWVEDKFEQLNPQVSPRPAPYLATVSYLSLPLVPPIM